MQYIIFLLLINVLTITAQSKYYEQSYTWEHIHDFYKIITNDTNIVFMGRHMSTDQMTKGHILQMDYWGISDTLLIYDNQYGDILFYDVVGTEMGYSVTGGMAANTDGFTTSFLLHTDHWGNELARYNIGDTSIMNQNYCRAISKITDNNNFIAVGTIQDELGYLHLYAKKVSYDGNTIWEQVYDNYPLLNRFTDVVSIPGEEDFYALGTVGSSNFNGNVLIARISNETGEMLEEYVYDFINNDDFEGSLDMLYDDGIVYLGGGATFLSSYVVKLNPDFTVNWINDDDIFWSCGPGGIVKALDGNYVITGCNDPLGASADMELLKLNADNGDIMWRRFYGGNYHDYGYDIALSPDGGFIVAGRQDTIGSAAAWVLKLNCMGLLTEPQASFTHRLEGLELYLQNTSQYVYPDSTDGGYYLLNYGDGSPAQTITTDSLSQFSHSYQAPGSYTITLTAIVCNDTSIYTQTVQVYPVGINNYGLAGGDIVQPLYITALNATSQTLHYQLPPNQTQGNILIYNLSGQLVDTLPLGATQGQTPLHQTTQWPAGLYLVQLRSAGGQHLGSAKLLVE